MPAHQRRQAPGEQPAGDGKTLTSGGHDPLRTGGYAKTLTFTLSTTNP